MHRRDRSIKCSAPDASCIFMRLSASFSEFYQLYQELGLIVLKTESLHVHSIFFIVISHQSISGGRPNAHIWIQWDAMIGNSLFEYQFSATFLVTQFSISQAFQHNLRLH